MRALISKVLTGSMIAGAALAVSACGPKTETTTDNMTAVDGTMNGGMMANDAMMANDTMMSNDTMMTNNMM